MIILELATLFLMLLVTGLVLTQYAIPTLRGTRTWWLFRKGSPIKEVNDLKVELTDEQKRSEAAALKRKAEKIVNLRRAYGAGESPQQEVRPAPSQPNQPTKPKRRKAQKKEIKDE